MKYIRRFADINANDTAIVGGKNSSLGEMYSSLTSKGVKIPNGFATTADAYWYYIRANNLEDIINETLDDLDVGNIGALRNAGAKIRNLIAHAEMPKDLELEIHQAYKSLYDEYGKHTDVAVRSSATAEDLPEASFAGQQESYLNIRGKHNLVSICKRVYASLFTNRAIAYRVHNGFKHSEVALSIGIQKMVRSDKGTSGVMFTLDTESGFRDVVFITAAYGLGENVVQGALNPDEFYVYKPFAHTQRNAIISRNLGSKAIKMIYTADESSGASTRNINVAHKNRERFCISDDDVMQLAKYASTIEEHYSELAQKARPMDIEWAKDGITGELFIVQARPETVQSQKSQNILEIYHVEEHGEKIITGKSVGSKLVTGRVRVVHDASHMHEVQEGEVLVSDITDPDWEPVMKRAAAVVTNRGGRTCHAAIIAREIGIPAIVGCGNATDIMPEGEVVTVSCADGDEGIVYQGEAKYHIEKIDLGGLQTPKTKLMLNVGNPSLAFQLAQLPSAGVGLARLEFIINNHIGIHPKALLEYDAIPDDIKEQIAAKIKGYANPIDFYVEKLTEGVATIAAAFCPRPVVVRLSDFKSNEYASLLGGSQFEPKEENPMIGFRGASRYYSANFSDAFALECQAIKKAREEIGMENIAIMVPFTRSLGEAKRVIEILAENGLKRGEAGLKIYLMCEVPANALLAEQFLEYFDGFSIGSNDLTQLTLGIDRDSSMKMADLDERNEAVLVMMKMAIDACQKKNKHVSICGQAPSDFPEISEWLVEQGIEAMSLNPDSLLKVTQHVLKLEDYMQSSFTSSALKNKREH